MTFRALCNDCLRAPSYETEAEQMAAHGEDVFCQCGGQLCACDFCLATLALLETGERGALNGRLQGPIVDWSAEGGRDEQRPDFR